VVCTVRKTQFQEQTAVGEISEATDWGHVLSPIISAVVHLAARVPEQETQKALSPDAYRKVNTLGTINLARQCAESGVRHFIFLSTAKVMGEGRTLPYSDLDTPAPTDAYALSKWEAEQGLRQIERDTGMAVTILRPPLVYGPGVKGNFRRLLRLVESGLPLPFSMVQNQRSMIGVENLSSLILQCLAHPKAKGQTFLVSEGQDCSTADLVRLLAQTSGKKPRLVPVPMAILRLAGTLLGRSAEIDRLLGSFAIDSCRVRTVLGWQPPLSLRAGIERLVGITANR
jgi:nucleoside-diphosphate-sugar epimerase